MALPSSVGEGFRSGVLSCFSGYHFQAMRSFRGILSMLLFLVLCCAQPARAQATRAAASELARRILTFAGSNPAIAFHFTNRSSSGVTQTAALRRELQSELESKGAKFVASGAGAIEVDVTLSQNWRSLLLVARVVRGSVARVVMVAFAPPGSESETSEPVVSLSRHFVWRQRAPFLSFLAWRFATEKSPYLWILEPGRLVLYRREGGEWRASAGAKIPHSEPWPRDVRGSLWVEPAISAPGGVSAPPELRASLPGVTCAMPLAPVSGRLPLTCQTVSAGASSYPLFEGGVVAAMAVLSPGMNFFSSASDRGVAPLSLPPFYSAAFVRDDRSRPVLVAAALDGTTYLYDSSGKTEGEVEGWGSAIAGIESSCGDQWQVLATRPGDWTQNDSLAAYEIADGKAVPTGEPIDFSGPILGLSTAPGGHQASAVFLDLSAGLYEAYSITVTCQR